MTGKVDIPLILRVGDELLTPATAAERVKIARALMTRGVLLDLVSNGHAEALVNLIRSLEPEHRAIVLTAEGAVAILAGAGQAKAAIALVGSLETPEQRARALAGDTVPVLAQKREAKATIEVIQTLEPHQRASLLGGNDLTLASRAPGSFMAMRAAIPENLRDAVPTVPTSTRRSSKKRRPSHGP